MKRLSICMFNITVLLLAGVVYADTTQNDSKFPNPYVITYPFKSAIIRYDGRIEYGHGEKAKGLVKSSNGAEVVYIKGNKMAKVIKMTTPGPDGTTENTKTLQIFTPEYVYLIDLIDRKGIKMDNSKKYGKAAYDKLSGEEKKAFHERIEKRRIVSLDLLGLGHKVGTDKILERKCEVYESGEKLTQEDLLTAIERGTNPFYMKTWVWDEAKIPLKIVRETLGSISELIATKIEENVKISDNQFTVPADVKITYDQEKSEAAKQQTMARFQLYKTGLPMVRKFKVEKEIITPKRAEIDEKNQKTPAEEKKDVADNSGNTYTERILNYLSDVFKR